MSSVSPFDTRAARSTYPDDGTSMRAHREAAKGAALTNSLSRHGAPLFGGGARKSDQAARRGSSNGIGQTLLSGVGTVAAWDEDDKSTPTAAATSTLHPVAAKNIDLDPLSRSLFSAMLTKADNVGRTTPLDVTSSNVSSAFAVSLETASGMIATLFAKGLITRSHNSMGGCDGWRVGA